MWLAQLNLSLAQLSPSLFLFIFSIQANINKLEDAGIFTLNCNSPGSTQFVAESLDDLAELIDEVGIDSLCSQLDLDCSALP